MKERPILFSAPMVRAILDGSKTQTRRVVKLPHSNPLGQWEPTIIGGENGGRTAAGETLPLQGGIWHTRTGDSLMCPYGQPGDRLWVRETWYCDDYRVQNGPYVEVDGARDLMAYRADGERPYEAEQPVWRPSIHMPRWASRILLEIVSVRVERLHEISEQDAIAEGIERMPCAVPDTKLWKNYNAGNGCTPSMAIPQNSFRSLWESINGEANWLSNPWVWVVEFKRVEA